MVKKAKAFQGARDASVGALLAAVAANALCRLFPELEYSTAFTFCLVVGSGVSRMFWNWRKHNKKNGGLLALSVAALALAPAVSGCFSTTAKYYFKERVDKGVVLEGAWQDTGINIKLPGDPLTAGSLNLGRRVGWGVLAAQPLDEDDAMFYEHTEGLRAGPDTLGATVESQTTVRNDVQAYLGAERACPSAE